MAHTMLQERADIVARLLALKLEQALGGKLEQSFGAPTAIGSDLRGTLRIEMYLSVDDAEKLAALLGKDV